MLIFKKLPYLKIIIIAYSPSHSTVTSEFWYCIRFIVNDTALKNKKREKMLTQDEV